MKYAAPLSRSLLPVLAALALVTAGIRSKTSMRVYSNDTNDNPHKFHMAFTTNTLDHTMTYDPRAADEWLFYTGGVMKTNRR